MDDARSGEGHMKFLIELDDETVAALDAWISRNPLLPLDRPTALSRLARLVLGSETTSPGPRERSRAVSFAVAPASQGAAEQVELSLQAEDGRWRSYLLQPEDVTQLIRLLLDETAGVVEAIRSRPN
jgi:hypothetical protein